MEDKLLKSIFKKAIGYKVSEVSEEYNVDSNGIEVLNKRKITKKYVPPDLSALKTYLELTNSASDYEGMSDEELLNIKENLIKELKISENSKIKK